MYTHIEARSIEKSSGLHVKGQSSSSPSDTGTRILLRLNSTSKHVHNANVVGYHCREEQGWCGEMRDKVMDRAALAAELAAQRAAGKRVVFTNGVFDLVHSGHVRYLREAASFGDLLVVGVNSDASVRSFKEAGRPIVPEADRVEVVAALEMVDYVVLFGEVTAEALVAELKPEVYVKGGDYRPEMLPEAGVVQGYGGQVKLVPYREGRSTTGIIQKILESYCPQAQGTRHKARGAGDK